ncbi:NUDIX domain-containing protein [Dyadobacter chenwenxiniae]|uniref:NUDIX domain-containing protein n=1 Tax=Dyadobacter chenwenxiniae TaxID=2906456 RepID=A0A9X1TGN8_9BACT|nr:NUDIX domain-containing protein [Dyadobacter chenwenxiniae]MCF0063835.1 NUDIX domain-containing protein [Dyadobacter chenwenxiniae]UON83512.1 NUDIX domain-containing protein [Dyadobacter chenwenxiniae]
MDQEFRKQETNSTGEGYLPGLAIDTVIFGFHENELKVLLLTYMNTGFFALPGGFIYKDEDINQAARRILFHRTGLKDIYLEQFYTFGDKSRHDTEPLKKIMAARGFFPEDSHWLLRRFVSVGYYALVDFTKAIPSPDSISDSCDWFNLSDLPGLMQDHEHIIARALQTIRQDLDHKLIGFKLLPEHFTMSELQRLYETILNKKLLRAAFQRKMLGLGVLERIAKKWTGGAHKAPYLYKFISQNTSF